MPSQAAVWLKGLEQVISEQQRLAEGSCGPELLGSIVQDRKIFAAPSGKQGGEAAS